MSVPTRWHVVSRPLAVCLSASLALAGVAAFSGAPARATGPVLPLATVVLGQDGTGTIKGKLVWGGDKAPKSTVLQPQGNASKDPSVCAVNADILDQKLVVDPKTLGVKWGFAYLLKPSGDSAAAVKALVEKNPQVEIDQKECVFIPHSVALHQDQVLVFKSSDAANHNVHLSGFVNAFNFVLPNATQASKSLAAEKRVAPLTCDIHGWMKANVLVLAHPFFAVTNEDGSFEIKNVPPGAQHLIVWQEAVGYANPGLAKGMPVEVAAGKVTDVGSIKLDPAKVK